MRKALVIGINNYPFGALNCSVSDATDVARLLSRNKDNSKNFDVKLLLDFEANKSNILENLKDLFLDEVVETALFYFSGHGFDSEFDGSIVSIDATDIDPGIRMTDILNLVKKSKIKNKIIILDCCYAGRFGNIGIIGDSSVLPEGTIILTASGKRQVAFEVNGHGVFTNLLLEAISGGASDILGRVTPGGIYSYIDQALSSWEQRPLFKTNVSRFVVIRQNDEKISGETLRQLTNIFTTSDMEFQLDPSFEPTNIRGGIHYNLAPYADSKNTTVFDTLQQYNRLGLLIPIGTKHMYYAAMETRTCKLTPLGKHYWNLVKKNLV